MDDTHLSTKDAPAPPVSCNDERSSDISKRASILQEAQQLIDEINDKRKHEELICQYRKDLEKHVKKRCSLTQQQMLAMFEEHSKLMEQKLNKLAYCLERAAKAESELLELKRSLAMLYQDMQQDLQEIARY